MVITEVVIAAVAAGVMMGIATEIGYGTSIIRANLLRIDGEFAANLIGLKPDITLIYLFGIAVHLVTSASFGAGLFIIAKILNIDVAAITTIAFYVFALWLSMLFIALPVAGHGIFGRRLGSSIWVEQLILHIIFAVGLWIMLNIF
ncbi:MAG: hypothetical protein FP814_02350 [Desulfobacterium sp.]|nr:hypothetical protein [Desulfobacterium sp.]MBU3949284.1 hypothetical protein [Pseudomonadota bacterium]MBU4009929.1 hypothetical protein [Pseudomonadota bacterium]MBU4035674.1 hypothetical protein [Pseudomonadota bacterium]